jgi:hypothetical protein
VRRFLLLLVLAGGCSTPQMGLHLDTATGHVRPSLATTLGPVTVGASGAGGTVGTRLGPVGLSAGF